MYVLKEQCSLYRRLKTASLVGLLRPRTSPVSSRFSSVAAAEVRNCRFGTLPWNLLRPGSRGSGTPRRALGDLQELLKPRQPAQHLKLVVSWALHASTFECPEAEWHKASQHEGPQRRAWKQRGVCLRGREQMTQDFTHSPQDQARILRLPSSVASTNMQAKMAPVRRQSSCCTALEQRDLNQATLVSTETCAW